MGVKISPATEKKLLEKHDVTRKEVIECFENRLFSALKDTRADARERRGSPIIFPRESPLR